jgi:hypothetical protein
MGSCLVHFRLTLSWRRRRRDPPRTAPVEGCMHRIPHGRGVVSGGCMHRIPHGRGQPRDGDEHAKALPIDETHRAVDAQLRARNQVQSAAINCGMASNQVQSAAMCHSAPIPDGRQPSALLSGTQWQSHPTWKAASKKQGNQRGQIRQLATMARQPLRPVPLAALALLSPSPAPPTTAPPTPAPPTPASHCPSTSSAGTSASVSIVSAVATRPISGREMSSSHGQLRVAKSAQST